MSDNIFYLIVITLGPVLIYTTVALALQLPELVAGWPAAVRHSIEAVGGLMVVGAWLTIDTVGGALAVLGLLLLVAPSVARYLSQTPETLSGQEMIHGSNNKKSARLM